MKRKEVEVIEFHRIVSGNLLDIDLKPAKFEWRNTSQSVYRYALLRVHIKVDY